MKQLFANNAKTTLASPIAASSSALVVSDGSKFPNPGANEYFLVTLELSGQIEIIMCTSRTGNTFTIGGFLESGQTVPGRGQELTIAQSFVSGAKVECRVTKGSLDRTSKGLAAIASVGLMVSPAASFNEGYVIGTLDPVGNPIVAVAKDANTWRFLNYTSQVTQTVVSATTTSVTGSSISITDVAAGKYIIQFTSGAQTGRLASVSSIASNTVTFSPALPAAAVAGTTFEILKASSSIINDALANLSFPIADNAGSGDAITATYSAAAQTLTDNVTVLVVLGPGVTNTIAAPTFAPNGLVPKVLTNNDGTVLAVGQLKGTLMLRYESSTDDWRVIGNQQSSVIQPVNYFIGNL
jgi:hypothetical protein